MHINIEHCIIRFSHLYQQQLRQQLIHQQRRTVTSGGKKTVRSSKCHEPTNLLFFSYNLLMYTSPGTEFDSIGSNYLVEGRQPSELSRRGLPSKEEVPTHTFCDLCSTVTQVFCLCRKAQLWLEQYSWRTGPNTTRLPSGIFGIRPPLFRPWGDSW